MNTSDFAFGAGQAFPADAFSSKAMMDATGSNAGGIPDTMDQSNQIFNEVGGMQSRAFQYGRDTLGHKVAVGTEIPLAKPTWLAPDGTPPSTQEYYEAMFARIDATYPIDYCACPLLSPPGFVCRLALRLARWWLLRLVLDA